MNYFDDILKVLDRASHLGCKQLPDGTRLIGHVPHVAPQAYLHAIFPALGDQGIARIETMVQRAVPVALEGLFRRANGLSMFNSLNVFGLRERTGRSIDEAWQPFSIETPNVHERPPGAAAELLFFGSYRSDGSKLGISEDSGEIVRCERRSGRVLTTWQNLPDMLVSEAKRLAKLFDEQGRKLPGVVTAPDET